jgi:hypothetical protein
LLITSWVLPTNQAHGSRVEVDGGLTIGDNISLETKRLKKFSSLFWTSLRHGDNGFGFDGLHHLLELVGLDLCQLPMLVDLKAILVL